MAKIETAFPRVEDMPAFMSISHERIHPSTLIEDTHIKSFNPILEREVIGRFEFESFGDAEAIINRFMEFYNGRRLHSPIEYRTPREAYQEWKQKQEGISTREVLS